MAGHFIDCFAPGVGPEAASDRIAAALSRVQRKVLSRQRLTPGGQAPVAGPGTLRWRVQKLREDGGSFLVRAEPGEDSPAVASVVPGAGRSVVFARSDASWHAVAPIRPSAPEYRYTVQVEMWR